MSPEKKEALLQRMKEYKADITRAQVEAIATAMESEILQHPPLGIRLQAPYGYTDARSLLKDEKVPKLHITNTHPDSFQQFHAKNNPNNPLIHKYHVVPPGWLLGAQHQNAGRYFRKKKSKGGRPIDGSWWGISLEGALIFAECNNGRGWVSQRIPLYLHVVYPVRNGRVNRHWAAIRPMGGGVQPWYLHSTLEILADEIYELIPLGGGAYTMRLIWRRGDGLI